ncbi:uncharacterized protein LDX57_004535 [Aspergillus melleus]|uniref:uncharacterized protein n=1 Tax=Aspergillus melleus TaxID=138277 RepID=UPI001E8E44C1|nr:uncharacterized protein LDX57_004535 [Aspergillus melleus]KAH8426805.1 hypothetical protein LDX57_004535 [Aspergillus melleus]
MGSIWPSDSSMARNLRKLQESITTVPAPGSQANRRDGPNESWSIDAQLLWDVLVYEKAGRHNASADETMFDKIIDLEFVRHDYVAELAMVGSAGISGHKSAWKEISAYAPEDSAPHPPPSSSSNPSFPPVHSVADGSNVPDERLFEGLGNLDMISQGDYLFQAEDFGRAINCWFNFNMTDHS